jgi:hypothetical protein
MPLPFVLPSFAFGGGELKGFDGCAALILYKRGSEIVEEGPKGAWAIRGTITVCGHSFDTIERAGGFVALKPGTYPAKMERSPGHGVVLGKDGKVVKDVAKKDIDAKAGQKWLGRRQLRPSHTQKNDQGAHAAILIHPGGVPSDFVGCIGLGVKSTKGLTKGQDSFETFWKLLGGFKEGKIVQLTVEGDNPGKVKPK